MPVTRAQARRLLNPDWVRAADMPDMAARYAETYIKRRVMAVEDRAVRDLWALYRAAYTDIRALMDNADERNLSARIWRQTVMDGVQRRITRLTDDAAALALREATSAYLGGYYGRAWLLDSITNDAAQIRPQRYAPEDVARYLAGRGLLREVEYGDIITSLLGREWRDVYKLELDNLVSRIGQSIMTGITSGEGIPPIARRVRDVMGVSTDRRAGYQANFNRVQTITRTVVNKASNDGAYTIYQQNADVLIGYRWLAARDERVCPTCRGLNGTLYQMRDQFRPPAHPNCRCTIIPEVNPALLAPMEKLNAPPQTTLGEWSAGFGLWYLMNDFMEPTAMDSERIGALPDEVGEWE